MLENYDYDYEYTTSFKSIELEYFYEDGVEKANLDKFLKNLSSFLKNYSVTDFHLFCLNFDYMIIRRFQNNSGNF